MYGECTAESIVVQPLCPALRMPRAAALRIALECPIASTVYRGYDPLNQTIDYEALKMELLGASAPAAPCAPLQTGTNRVCIWVCANCTCRDLGPAACRIEHVLW